MDENYIDPNDPMGTAGIGFTLLRLYEESNDKTFPDAVNGIKELHSALALKLDDAVLPTAPLTPKILIRQTKANISAPIFLLAKRIYNDIKGREQTNDIIAYQIRQSFKPWGGVLIGSVGFLTR